MSEEKDNKNAEAKNKKIAEGEVKQKMDTAEKASKPEEKSVKDQQKTDAMPERKQESMKELADDEARKKEFRKNLVIAIVAIVITLGVVAAILIPMGVFTLESARPETPEETPVGPVETIPEKQGPEIGAYAQDYYDYIQEQDILRKNFDYAKIEEYEIGFIDVKVVDEPVMIINGIYDNSQAVMYLYKSNGGVAVSKYAEPAEIEYLYDKESGKYGYFVEQELPNNLTRYVDIAKGIEDINQTNYKIISDSEFSKYYTDADDEIETVEVDKDASATELKDAMMEAMREYEGIDIDTRKDDDDTFELEGKTLRYGKYQWAEYNTYTKKNEVIDELVINSDGTCIYNDDTDCTWKIGSADFAQSIESKGKHIHDTVTLTYNNGWLMEFYALDDDKLTDGDITLLEYVGE